MQNLTIQDLSQEFKKQILKDVRACEFRFCTGRAKKSGAESRERLPRWSLFLIGCNIYSFDSDSEQGDFYVSAYT